ncbi:MAG: hypothetical protein E7456_06220 [Ruminococcaceae bacterium]|nr:hypothetical protein [Oscillospiraceae bacterium]
MLDFNKYFNEQYQFTLKNVSFSWVKNDSTETNFEIKISDSINTEIQNRHLEVVFKRKVYFVPEALFNLSVSFAFTLTFRDSICEEEMNSVNWSEAFTQSESPYLANIISRTSGLISSITSSFGQQPLVTPPNIIVKESDF